MGWVGGTKAGTGRGQDMAQSLIVLPGRPQESRVHQIHLPAAAREARSNAVSTVGEIPGVGILSSYCPLCKAGLTAVDRTHSTPLCSLRHITRTTDLPEVPPSDFLLLFHFYQFHPSVHRTRIYFTPRKPLLCQILETEDEPLKPSS